MIEHTEEFQKLNIRVNSILGKQSIDVFIRTLKDNIKHEFCLQEPHSLEKTFRLPRKMESKIMATRKPTTHKYKDGSFVAPSLPQRTSLSPQKWEEKRAKGLCYSCDGKYTKDISVMRRNQFKQIVNRRKVRNMKRQKKRTYTRNKL